ncbi:MAG: 3'(2'),5'-bisphosphate nucleotidase CysQ, partial [Candidatus Marinimicrobia bacterium]|nr:3'(2'),5'-bisphosphate nucleotidase CysQ [Candidatus Neomarinimicrobiota bacterium]
DRKRWQHFWLVDPLDGTKEFIKKNGEFTVNIGLIEKGVPVFGVVYAPVVGCIYWGGNDYGAFKMENSMEKMSISVKTTFLAPILVAGSRSHPGDKMKTFLNQFDNTEVIPMGSSLKICSVAEGKVHVYPRLGPTMEWDTGAAHAILKAAGGEINKYGTNTPLTYNKQNLLNPEFIAGNIKFMDNLIHVK